MKKQVVVALFAVAFLFSLAFVSANWVTDAAGTTKDFLKEFASGTPDVAWAKWLFFFLILIVVFGISEVLPFFDEKGWLSALFSIIVAFLATFFLTPQQVLASLISYKAFGITVTAIAPFLLLVFISYKCYKKKEVVFSKILWIMFIVTLLWLSVTGFANDEIGAGSLALVYPVVFILSVLMFFFEGRIHAWFYKGEIERTIQETTSDVQRDALIKIAELQDKKINNIGNAKVAAAIDAKIDALKKIAKIK